MSPSERQAKAIEKGIQDALTLDEEARITEGEHIRRKKPIGEPGHLKRMLDHLKEQEEREEVRREYEARKQKQDQQECPHDEHDHGICLECSKDIMDDLIERAELLKDE